MLDIKRNKIEWVIILLNKSVKDRTQTKLEKRKVRKTMKMKKKRNNGFTWNDELRDNCYVINGDDYICHVSRTHETAKCLQPYSYIKMVTCPK